MSELTDALIQLLGPRIGLLAVLLITADVLQTRYLAAEIGGVEEDVDEVETRVRRVETYHMETDGGECDD